MTFPIRRPIIGGNWKMNTDVAEARTLATALAERIEDAEAVEVVICPPFTNIQAVAEILDPTPLVVGAQNVFWEPKGAFTGEISAAMLVSVGASYVIAGHSERRHLLGETNEVVNRKARAAIQGGLSVILCVGETEDERTGGRTEAVLAEQLTGSLVGFEGDDVGSVVIAYEPVWAIGTGLTASTAQAQEAHAFIRQWLAERFGPEQAEKLRIQYGGSVTAANAFDLLGMPDVDGALVGGASLKPDDFAAIVAAQNSVIAG